MKATCERRDWPPTIPAKKRRNCFLFVKKVEKDGRISIVLRKLFQESTAVLPMKKGPDGNLAPQADLLDAVNALAENSPVVVQMDQGQLKSIKAYEPPKRVEFVKMVEQKIDADTTTKLAVPEHTLVGMEVKDNGASATIMVDPKDRDAKAKAGRIGTFKAGQFLLIRSNTNGKDTWLVDARVDPSQTSPKNSAQNLHGTAFRPKPGLCKVRLWNGVRIYRTEAWRKPVVQ